MLPIGSGKRLREGFFGPRAWEAARLACNSVRCARPNGNPVTLGSGSDATMAGIVDSTSRGGWPVSRAVQDMFVLGVEHAPTKSDTAAPDGLTRIGLQDDIHRIGRCSQPVLE